MATPGRHSDSESAAPFSWIPWVIVGYVTLVLVIGGSTLVWILARSDVESAPRRNPLALASPGNSPSARAASPSPSAGDELITNAKKLKPLEDIQKGDRVIFRGRVCVWRLWNNNINTSTIKCPGKNLFQTQTARLTPVELRGG